MPEESCGVWLRIPRSRLGSADVLLPASGDGRSHRTAVIVRTSTADLLYHNELTMAPDDGDDGVGRRGRQDSRGRHRREIFGREKPDAQDLTSFRYHHEQSMSIFQQRTCTRHNPTTRPVSEYHPL